MIAAANLSSALTNRLLRDDLAGDSLRALGKSLQGDLSEGKIKEAARDFEELFVSNMLEHMFSGDSIGSSLFGDSETDEIYQSMMVENYSKAIVKAGGIGIASHLETILAQRALLQTQEV